jgi:hypothetical protein
MSSFGATASCPMASVSIAGRTRTRQFDDRSSIELAGVDMTRRAAKEAFTKAGITPDDILELRSSKSLFESVAMPMEAISIAWFSSL